MRYCDICAHEWSEHTLADGRLARYCGSDGLHGQSPPCLCKAAFEGGYVSTLEQVQQKCLQIYRELVK